MDDWKADWDNESFEYMTPTDLVRDLHDNKLKKFLYMKKKNKNKCKWKKTETPKLFD